MISANKVAGTIMRVIDAYAYKGFIARYAARQTGAETRLETAIRPDPSPKWSPPTDIDDGIISEY